MKSRRSPFWRSRFHARPAECLYRPQWSPVPQLSLDLGYHFLATAAKLRNADKPLGHEVEFSASYDLGHTMSISLGYSFMRCTKTMEVLKRTFEKRELHWAWLMFRAAPRFLQSKR